MSKGEPVWTVESSVEAATFETRSHLTKKKLKSKRPLIPQLNLDYRSPVPATKFRTDLSLPNCSLVRHVHKRQTMFWIIPRRPKTLPNFQLRIQHRNSQINSHNYNLYSSDKNKIITQNQTSVLFIILMTAYLKWWWKTTTNINETNKKGENSKQNKWKTKEREKRLYLKSNTQLTGKYVYNISYIM